MRRAVLLAVAALGIAPLARAEEPASAEEQLFELNDALTRETTVASTHGLSIRETPGVVSVITHEEIAASGASDLLGVLMLVPGFAPAVDVEGVVDVGLRGIWGHEGKILLLVDGVEMNDLLYSSNQLGMHYPVDQLDQVEIIRGPGSVRYGGFAELAVINLKTRTGKQLSGAEASVRMGAREHGLGTRTVSLSGGAATERFGGASISIAGYLGEGSRSERDYVDPAGRVAHLAFQSALRPAFFNVGAELHGVLLRIIHDGYQLEEQDSYGSLLSHPAALGFTSDAADLTYHWKATPRLTVTPRLTWRRQTPWELLDGSVGDFYTKTVQRWSGGVTAAYDLLDTLTLTGGLEGYTERAWLNDTTLQGSQTQFNGFNEVSYRNAAALVEGQYASFIGNLIGGLRYEHHSKFGDSLVPRLALTKVLGAFHFKLLASRAFRAPAIENINAGVDVKPETTTGLEAEVGYQLSDNLFVSANGFNTVVSDPIVYAVDPATQVQSYRNFNQTGSRGVELEGRASFRLLTARLSYAFAHSALNRVDLYDVPGHVGSVLGLPRHKVTAQVTVKLWRDVSFDPSVVILGERFGYQGDGNGGQTLVTVDTKTLLNAFVGYSHVLGSELDLRAGISNLLDQDLRYIQPYAGGHPPLPGPGREYQVQLAARFQ